MDEEQCSSWPWIISVLDSKRYCCILLFLYRFDNRRATVWHLNSIRFELVADKQPVRSIRYQNGLVQ